MKSMRPRLQSYFQEDNFPCMDQLVENKQEKDINEEDVYNSDKDSVYSGILLLNNLKSMFIFIIILYEYFLLKISY